MKSHGLEFTYLSGPRNLFKLKNSKQYYVERTFAIGAPEAGRPAGSRRGWSAGLEAALCRAPAAGLRPQDLGYIPDFVQTAMAPYINSPKIHIHQRVSVGTVMDSEQLLSAQWKDLTQLRGTENSMYSESILKSVLER
ncbi:Supervillin [Manis pentadactyla]|nr:Supervillin [Manis pentadactyla]